MDKLEYSHRVEIESLKEQFRHHLKECRGQKVIKNMKQSYERTLKKILKENKMKKREEGTSRFPKMKEAAKVSLNKQINGKVMLFISIYIMVTAIFEVGAMFFPSTIHPFWSFVIRTVVGVFIYVLCVLFNIDNPSVAKVFRDIAEFILDETIDDTVIVGKIKIYLAALNQKFMQVFDRQGEKISEGVVKVETDGGTTNIDLETKSI